MILGVSLFIAYLCANEITKKGKHANKASLICFVTGFLAAFLTGNRTWPLAVFFSFVITYLLNLQVLGRIRSFAAIKVKYVIAAFFIFSVLLTAFYYTTFALGRENTMSPLYYISVYLGAPLKNLDIAISQGITRSSVPGEYSFNFLFISLNKKLGVNSSLISSLPYQSVNNNPIGNVYTIYFALLTDFGLIGCLFAMMLLGIAVQLIHEKSMLTMTHKSLSFLTIIYGYVMFQLMTSFFAHFIMQNIVSLGFLKSICAILVLYVVGSRVQMKSIPEPIMIIENRSFEGKQYKSERI
jgi:oligosaccharide repeat unit polymerase